MRGSGFKALLVVFAVLLSGCGEGESGDDRAAGAYAAEASHVHGLGIDPADESLFIATHGGLFQVAAGSQAPRPVGSVDYDLMGFTVAGRDRFLASGHPAPGEEGPPHLGLIESRDGGRSWREVSLGGRADFHVLRHSGGRIYGFNGLDGRLMISNDGGASWRSQTPPAPLFDLAVDPRDPDRFIAASEAGLLAGTTGGEWKRAGNRLGLLAWPESGSVFLADGEGVVSLSRDRGRSWRRVGNLPEAPVSFYAAFAQELYVALPDGTVLQSRDGGRSWSARVQP